MATAVSPVIGVIENGFWVLGWRLPDSPGIELKKTIMN